MFQPVPIQFTMSDPERGYSWRAAGSTDRGEIAIAGLTMDGIEIPYEYRIEHRLDDTGEWYEIKLGAFGSSIAGQLHSALLPVRFATVEEREAAVLVAIEATLAWLPSGDGLGRGDGYNRATFRGVQYRLSDFGPYFEKSEVGG
jgi:hypothetical protein